ncbi:hypothetical protein BDA99DRAFT_609535 [Phascolomyces articulosus]|uniref:CCHC-type domain-containing protein n=1 Tax=Phascolomyces articulosus TaxID=60185 RepID=A0AAD5P802_9FUNG|nr:hypothetical protein BDA99DRAFT_609535 [Phascolomyces articulosus]
MVTGLASNKHSESSSPLINNVKPINLSGGQCSHCGQYGHTRQYCLLLRPK